MKKSVMIGLLAAAGGAAYLLSKLANKKEDTEKKIITITVEEDESRNDQSSETDETEEVEEAGELEEPVKTEEPLYSREVQEINLMYPYLKPAFITNCLKEQLSFNQEYPEGTFVTVYHDISFPVVEDLITFVRIIKEHDYQISEADGDQSLSISKDLIVENGRILSDILNVSNQVCCLNGDYHGFRLETK